LSWSESQVHNDSSFIAGGRIVTMLSLIENKFLSALISAYGEPRVTWAGLAGPVPGATPQQYTGYL